jgi:NitT/TauT family transport system substrate-binding protein
MNGIRLFLAIAAGLLCFAACTDSGDNKQTDNEIDTWELDSASLRIAVMPTIDCLPLYVAEEEGLFDRESVSVSLYPYQAQIDCDTAIKNGWVDVMMTDLVRAERLKSLGTPLRYLTATELQWQLLAGKNARLKKLGQLENKMIAVTRYSATAMLADALVDSASVVDEHVFRIQVNNLGIRLQMLETETMDAMFLPQPQATAARQIGAEVLYDTRWNDVCMGVMVASEASQCDTLRQRLTKGMLKAYAEACDSINKRGVRFYSKMIARRCGLKNAVTDSLPSDIHFNGVRQPREQDITRANSWLNK